ncbi:1679_t:CDS:2, partial [Cetraspora pellucida]
MSDIISENISKNIFKKNKRGHKESCVWDHFNKESIEDFAKAVFKKCQILISFFKNSYHAGVTLQEDIINSFIKDGGLKTSVKTRWSTAWDCCNSIIRLKNSLKNVFKNQSEIFQDALNIKNILRNQQFCMKIWKNFGKNTNSCKILLIQFRKYSEKTEPYNMEYIENHDTPEIWWTTCKQSDNYIQKLALKMFVIVPYQAACER